MASYPRSSEGSPAHPARARAWRALLAVVLAGASRAGAQDSGPAPLTLADALRLAIERNADFRVAETQVDAALAQLRVVREYPNPTLGLSTAKISTDGTPE